MRTAIAKALDHEMAPLSPVRIVLASVVALGCFGLSAAGLQQAWHKTQRMEMASVRDLTYREIEATTDFGRTLAGQDGRFISWNHGMTAILGWSSKEMVGQTAERLNLDDAPPNSLMADRLFSPRDFLWKADGEILLKAKDGSIVHVDAVVLDFAGKREVTIKRHFEDEPS